MVYLPGGTFTMGAPDEERERLGHERPRHEVTLSPFCLARTEVTVAQYAACVQRGQCAASQRWSRCNWGVSGREDHPINCVSWDDASAYCASLSQRLPTEAEWEFAASDGGTRSHPWGDEAPSEQLCWSGVRRRSGTCPAGSFAEGDSPQGIADLLGNVAEWVSDWYGPYQAQPERDPRGATSGRVRVIRGGSWQITLSLGVRARFRQPHSPDSQDEYIGVRCAAGPLQ